MAPTSDYIPWDEIISNLDDERHLEPLSLVSKSFLSITNHYKQTLKIFDQTAHFLPSLFHRFPNLKHLSFAEFTEDPVPILHKIAHSGFKLETLDLSNHRDFPIKGFEKFPASILSSLKSFKMCSESNLGNDDLEAIAKFFPNLEELDLSHGRESGYCFDRVRLDLLYSSLKSLRKINLSGRDWVGDEDVISLAKNCPDLEEIVLKKCRNVSNSGVINVLEMCKKLKSIGLEGSRRTDLVLLGDYNPSRWTRNLREIDFSKMVVSDDWLKAMAEGELPLKKVALERCNGFTFDDGLRPFFEVYNSLDHLALVEVEFIDDSTIRLLAKLFKRLRYVKLEKCANLSDSTFFTLIKKCPLLESVEMCYTNLGDQGFEAGNDGFKHRKIRALNLMKNEKLSDESLEKIATTCPNLESLNLTHCVIISSECVGRVMRSACCFIKHLRVHGCPRVRDLGLAKHTYKLELLGATESGLDDCGLFDIAGNCPNLMFLELRGCAITSKGVLEVVDKCTKLKEIDYFGCNNMTTRMLPWMIAFRPSLRKIVPDKECPKIDGDQFWSRGCYVESERYYRRHD